MMGHPPKPTPSSSYLLDRHNPCKKNENKLPYTANATHISLDSEALSNLDPNLVDMSDQSEMFHWAFKEKRQEFMI